MSVYPGNNGWCKINYAIVHPNDQISIYLP